MSDSDKRDEQETSFPLREDFEATRATVDPHAEPPYEGLAAERRIVEVEEDDNPDFDANAAEQREQADDSK